MSAGAYEDDGDVVIEMDLLPPRWLDIQDEVTEYLTLTSGLGRERTSGVLGLVADGFRFIHAYLTTSSTRARFEAFTRSLLRPSYDEVGFA